jgi:hypothetical protein
MSYELIQVRTEAEKVGIITLKPSQTIERVKQRTDG